MKGWHLIFFTTLKASSPRLFQSYHSVITIKKITSLILSTLKNFFLNLSKVARTCWFRILFLNPASTVLSFWLGIVLEESSLALLPLLHSFVLLLSF